MYCVPSRWAEGQREHFCESYLIGFLHLVNCRFVLLRDIGERLPGSPSYYTSSEGDLSTLWTRYLLPLGRRAQVPGGRL